MIKHLVFFKFNDSITENDISDLEKSLHSLPGIITEIREFEVGRDVIHSERSFDLALISAFDDLAALNRYQVHPDHQAVVVKVKKNLLPVLWILTYCCMIKRLLPPRGLISLEMRFKNMPLYSLRWRI